MRRGTFSTPAADGGWVEVPGFGNAGTGEEFLIRFEALHRYKMDICILWRTRQQKYRQEISMHVNIRKNAGICSATQPGKVTPGNEFDSK
jgi:hypothetical protein